MSTQCLDNKSKSLLQERTMEKYGVQNLDLCTGNKIKLIIIGVIVSVKNAESCILIRCGSHGVTMCSLQLFTFRMLLFS